MASQLLFTGGIRTIEAKRFSTVVGKGKEGEHQREKGGEQMLSEGAYLPRKQPKPLCCAFISRISKEKVSRIVTYAIELGPDGMIYSFEPRFSVRKLRYWA
jgi:hypothetical protein